MSRLAAKIVETFRRIRERGNDGVWISLEPEDQAFKRAQRTRVRLRRASLERSNICH